MRRIVAMVALGIGGFVAAIGLTLGALALAGDDTGSVVQPQLSPSRESGSDSPSPSGDDEATDSPSPSADDHGDPGSDEDSDSDDDSGSGSGSGDSGSGSDNSGPGSDNSGSGSSGSGSDADDD